MTRQNAVLENPVKPYTFPEWLQMKPGTLLMGLAVFRNAVMPAERWYVSDPNVLENIKRLAAKGEGFPVVVTLEKGVRWRTVLKDRREVIGEHKVSLYRVSDEDFQKLTEKNPDLPSLQQDPTMTIRFSKDLPIGIFLGHVVRVSGVVYANILSSAGYDCWI